MSEHALILCGGGPLGVAFETGALLCLEDALGTDLRDKIGAVIGSSAGAVTGAYLCTGSGPTRILRSLSGRFPEEIEYFDPFLLLNFDPRQLPSLVQTLWRSTHFLVRDWWRKRQGGDTLEQRKALYDSYLASIRSVLDLVPPGWFQVDGLGEFLQRTLPIAEGKILRFDELDRILLVKATDLGRGVEAICGPSSVLERARRHPLFSGCEILAEASLVEAVLYSSSIPFLFTPPALQERYMADGEVRQAPSLKMAEHLLEAETIFMINPLTPLHGVQPQSPTSELFLQAILTLLEGNITAGLLLSGDGLPAGRTLDRKIPYVYVRPTAEQMARLTDRSIVHLFRYRPQMAAAGYSSMLRALQAVPQDLAREFEARGLGWDLTRAQARARQLDEAEQDESRLEGTLIDRAWIPS
jgi:predicted acylesterase/phospholipase RssA